MKKEWIKPNFKNISIINTKEACDIVEVENLTLMRSTGGVWYCKTHNKWLRTIEEREAHWKEANEHHIVISS